MFKSMKCRLAGHIFVDSRSQPGVQVCVRCRHRQTFEGLKVVTPPPPAPTNERLRGAGWSRLPGDPTPS